MSKFYNELKRRNVIKSTIAYLIVAWIVIQVALAVLPTFGAPDWVIQAVIIVLAIGLPIWIIISWVYDLTPQGIEKTPQESEKQTNKQIVTKRLNVFLLVSLSIAVVVMGLKLSNVFSDSNSQYAIAILPFENIQVDEGNEWLSKGFTQNVNSYLSKVIKLRVIDSYSSRQYKDTDKTNTVIGEELDVSYVLRGFITQLNNKLSITVELINVLSNKVIWSETFTEILDKDVLPLQQEVAQKIVRGLKVRITPREEKSLGKYPTQNLEAYKLYIQAYTLGASLNAYEITFAGFQQKTALYQQAIDLDPNFGDAYAEMANLNIQQHFNIVQYFDRENNRKLVNQQVEKALQLNSNSAKANAVKGYYFYLLEERYDEAKVLLEKALVLNPSSVRAHELIATYYMRIAPNDFKKGVFHIDKAQKLDPFSKEINYKKIWYLIQNYKFEAAEAHYDETSGLLSENTRNVLKNNLILFKGKQLSNQNKDWTEAVLGLEKAVKKDSNNSFLIRKLGEAFDEILNDNANYLKYTKKAYELESHKFNLNPYLTALMENDKFKEAELLMNTSNYKNRIGIDNELKHRFHFYYNRGDYEKAQEILKDTLIPQVFPFRIINYTQLGKLKKIDSLLKEGNNSIKDWTKPMIYAILKERDSMYHYLDKIEYFKWLNGRREFDPYRKDERYKALLKKHYLPLTHWNE